MRKIYLLTLVTLIGNAWLLQAANPQMAKNNGPDSRSVLSVTPTGSKSGSIIQYRQPSPGTNIHPASAIFSDNFDGANDTTSLISRGYIVYYRGGGPQGTAPTWFQGASATTFASYNGPADGYVASNYNSVTATNNIDNWLVLPSLSVASGDAISFYARSPLQATPFVDSLHVYYSAAGDSTPEATTWVLLGEFEVNYLGSWEFKQFAIPAASANGRLAIRYAVVDGGPTGTTSNYIGIDQLDVFTPSAFDLSAIRLTSPHSDCSLSAAENVTLVIHNFGLNPAAGFTASYALDGGTPIIETIAGPLASGDSLVYTFTAQADLSVVGSHSIVAGVLVVGDTNHINDTISAAIANVVPVDPYLTGILMGFEAGEDFSLWKVEDTNADGVIWDPIDTYVHTGTVCMRKAASAASDDDWIFTSCLDLTAGNQYHLDYWFKEFDLVAPCNIETFLATAPNSLSVTTLITQDAIPADTIYQYSIGTFTPNTSGTYYIGFHATTGTGSSAVRIDDINIFGTTAINSINSKTSISVYPNPNNGMFYLSSPLSNNNVLVEVFNTSGQKVYTSRINNLSRQFINLYNQANGVYNIRITSDTFVENHSVILSK